MGYVEIPRIDVKLPIYHGTSEEVLSRGTGHLNESSLPIGRNSMHTVLTGHRGLPSATLFTHLDKMEKGDVFYIHSLDKVPIYKVEQIKVVLPEEIDDLLVVKDQDYATLLTCTPYGVNTHRLLVKGHRVPDELKEKENKQSKPFMIEDWVIGVSVAALVVLALIIYIRKKKQRQRQES